MLSPFNTSLILYRRALEFFDRVFFPINLVTCHFYSEALWLVLEIFLKVCSNFCERYDCEFHLMLDSLACCLVWLLWESQYSLRNMWENLRLSSILSALSPSWLVWTMDCNRLTWWLVSSIFLKFVFNRIFNILGLFTTDLLWYYEYQRFHANSEIVKLCIILSRFPSRPKMNIHMVFLLLYQLFNYQCSCQFLVS